MSAGEAPVGDLQTDINEFYIDLLENQNVGIYRIRVTPCGDWRSMESSTYVYEYVNDRYCEIMDSSREELMRRPGKTLEHGDTLWTGVLADLTEQKIAEKSLSETTALIRSVSTSLASARLYQIVATPRGECKFTYVSNSVTSL